MISTSVRMNMCLQSPPKSGRRDRSGAQIRRRAQTARKKTPEVVDAIEILLEHDTAGDPITGIKWTHKTPARIAELLQQLDIQISPNTGHRPYRMRSRLFHEIVRVICEEPPTRPSTAVGLTEERPGMRGSKPITVTPEMVSRARDASPVELRRQLSGDLGNVLLKSLSKEPLARYRSAEQMSEDIRHHLHGEPVLATSETLLYRIGKFLQRYRIWVIAAVALAAALATRVVTIRPVGLLYFAGSLLTFGLWYAVTDRVMGRRIADWSTVI